ncbi:DinB family protein [Aureispira sp. CCB-E]|uniref:DinB family protein n=1 Tax=Aureispira sp. CCB-E TaxID=3051121 RepID=UPI002868DC3F|nr:DinB family protein [Aureispira sp. CCB-E]WMX16397.1 DinB family protein [Aureispira sp. CCB-E]
MKSSDLLQQVEATSRAILKLAEEHFAPLSSEVLNYKPNAQKWSIAECLEHLNYYSDYYNKEAQLAIEKAQKKQWRAVPTFNSTWLGKKSIESVHPNNTKPTQAVKTLNPSLSTVRPDVVQRFIQGQKEFLQLIEAARHINLNKAKVRIEVFKLLKLRLGDIFLFMIAHHQRHCNQALRVGNFEATLLFKTVH